MYRKIIPVLKRDLPIEDYQLRRSNYFTKKGLECLIQESELDELVELFFKAIQIEKNKDFKGLEGIEKKIIKEFLDESTETERKKCFEYFSDAEPIIKHLICVMAPTKLRNLNTLLPCFEMLDLVPTEDFDFKKPYKERPSDYPYLEQIVRVIKWRNRDAHNAPEPTRKELAELEESLWFAYLCLVKKYKAELRKCIKEKEKVEFERRDYCYKQLEYHNNRNRGFEYYDFMWKDISTNELMSIINTVSMKSNVCLLYGEAGSGKSVALSKLFCDAAEDHINDTAAPVPVYIELKELNIHNQKEIKDELLDVLQCTENELNQLLSHGNIMLFLDGINEIVGYDVIGEHGERDVEKSKVAIECQAQYKSQIAKIMNYYPRTKMWLSDREITLWGDSIHETQVITKMELQTIQREDIYKFYKCQYSESNLLDENNLLVQISDGMVKMVNTPFKLRMFCEFAYENNKIPENSKILIDNYLRKIINREFKDKGTLRLTSEEIFWDILMKLSHMVGRDNAGIDIYSARNLVRGILSKWENRVSEVDNCIKIASELKILQREGDSIRFFHKEYLQFLYLKYRKILDFEEKMKCLDN